jgi:hypothetical protein
VTGPTTSSRNIQSGAEESIVRLRTETERRIRSKCPTLMVEAMRRVADNRRLKRFSQAAPAIGKCVLPRQPNANIRWFRFSMKATADIL